LLFPGSCVRSSDQRLDNSAGRRVLLYIAADDQSPPAERRRKILFFINNTIKPVIRDEEMVFFLPLSKWSNAVRFSFTFTMERSSHFFPPFVSFIVIVVASCACKSFFPSAAYHSRVFGYLPFKPVGVCTSPRRPSTASKAYYYYSLSAVRIPDRPRCSFSVLKKSSQHRVSSCTTVSCSVRIVDRCAVATVREPKYTRCRVINARILFAVINQLSLG